MEGMGKGRESAGGERITEGEEVLVFVDSLLLIYIRHMGCGFPLDVE